MCVCVHVHVQRCRSDAPSTPDDGLVLAETGPKACRVHWSRSRGHSVCVGGWVWVCVFVVLCPLPGSGHVLLHSALVLTTTWWNEFVLTLVLVLCLCAGFISLPIFRSYMALKGCIPEQSDTGVRGGGKPSIRGGSQSGQVLAILATAREGCLHRCLDLRISFHEYMMYLCCCVCMYVLPTCECVPGRQWCCHIQLCS